MGLGSLALLASAGVMQTALRNTEERKRDRGERDWNGNDAVNRGVDDELIEIGGRALVGVVQCASH